MLSENNVWYASKFIYTIRTYFIVLLRVHRWAIEDTRRSELDDRSWIRHKKRHTSRVERSVSMIGSQPSTRSISSTLAARVCPAGTTCNEEPWNLDKPVLLQSLTSPAIGGDHPRLLSVHHSYELNLTPNFLILSSFPTRNDLSRFSETS